MTATIRTETVTATMEVSIGIDGDARDEFDSEFQTEREYVQELAEEHVCGGNNDLRNPQSVAISGTEDKGDVTVYNVTVHFMEQR